MNSAPSLVIVSGHSGAGRTTVMKALEDLGFYCVDNLPVVLLGPFVDLFGEGVSRLAAVIDVREGDFLDDFPGVADNLRSRGVLRELLFLEADEAELQTRFDATRRVHPLAAGEGVRAGIRREAAILAPIAERADRILDTTRMNVHDLKRFVTRHFSGAPATDRLTVDLVSFGFRYGPPEEADLMIDVRFLPNPNFEPELRDRDGSDPEVAAWVLEDVRTVAFLERFFDFVGYLLPLYEREGKAYLTLAIGCTGGRHRSVAVANALERHLCELKISARVTHRDADRQRRIDS
ncbi:MAG: RNase adapter RapZ [Myxococcales bacterium]|nr:RNase adapter RapZ [Myxococcales bacterium]